MARRSAPDATESAPARAPAPTRRRAGTRTEVFSLAQLPRRVFVQAAAHGVDHHEVMLARVRGGNLSVPYIVRHALGIARARIAVAAAARLHVRDELAFLQPGGE